MTYKTRNLAIGDRSRISIRDRKVVMLVV